MSSTDSSDSSAPPNYDQICDDSNHDHIFLELQKQNLIDVLQDWRNLSKINKQNQIEEMCIMAVEQSPDALEYVLINSSKVYLMAASKHILTFDHLKSIPTDYKTQEFYNLCLPRNWKLINRIPCKYMKKEFYEIAINQSWKALEHVPDRSKTDELCAIALKQNIYAVVFTPDKYITKKICKKALKKDKLLINYLINVMDISELEINIDYISCHSKFVTTIDYEHNVWIENKYDECLKRDGLLLKYAEGDCQTFTQQMIACTQNGLALQYATNIYNFKTNEKKFNYTSHEWYKENDNKLGVKFADLTKYYILQWQKVCLAAVTNNGLALQYVPRSDHTSGILEAAINQNSEAKIYKKNKWYLF